MLKLTYCNLHHQLVLLTFGEHMPVIFSSVCRLHPEENCWLDYVTY